MLPFPFTTSIDVIKSIETIKPKFSSHPDNTPGLFIINISYTLTDPLI